MHSRHFSFSSTYTVLYTSEDRLSFPALLDDLNNDIFHPATFFRRHILFRLQHFQFLDFLSVLLLHTQQTKIVLSGCMYALKHVLKNIQHNRDCIALCFESSSSGFIRCMTNDKLVLCLERRVCLDDYSINVCAYICKCDVLYMIAVYAKPVLVCASTERVIRTYYS